MPQKKQGLGDCALDDYVISVRQSIQQELLEGAWKIKNADELIRDENVDLIKILENFSWKSCVCNDVKLELALETLCKNCIDCDEFTQSLYLSIKEGRRKPLNILFFMKLYHWLDGYWQQ